MINRIRMPGLLLLAISFVVFIPFRSVDSAAPRRTPSRPLRCTAAALSAFKPIPKLDYECADRDDDNRKSPERQAALAAYLRELESVFADASWWAAPVDDLNVCSIINEARPMTAAERHDFLGNNDEIALYGDPSTRLIVITDPCIRYSYVTLNAFILQRDGDRVYATQLLNAYFSRADNAVAMSLAEHQGERLIFVEASTVDGSMPPSPYTTCAVYTIDPRSHRAMPKKLFKEGGKLTNQFRWDTYVFGDEDAKLADRWHEPEIIHNGKLSPRFYVYTLFKHRLARDTYIWNGKYYTRQR